jgi:Bacteriophage Gp15 protein.
VRVCDFNFLTQDLPHSVTYGGAEYSADFSVGKVLAVLTYKAEDTAHYLVYAFSLLFPDYDIDLVDDDALVGLVNGSERILLGYPMWGKQGKKKEGPPDLDWEQDSPALIASFRSVYGLSLAEVRSLHWWEFKCLLECLPAEGNILGEIRHIRSMDIPPDATPEMKKSIQKAKRQVAIQIRPGDLEALGRFI